MTYEQKLLLFAVSNLIVATCLVNGSAAPPLGTITLLSTKDTNTCFPFTDYQQHRVTVGVNSDQLIGTIHLQEDFISRRHLKRTTSEILKNRYFTSKGIVASKYQQQHHTDLRISTTDNGRKFSISLRNDDEPPQLLETTSDELLLVNDSRNHNNQLCTYSLKSMKTPDYFHQFEDEVEFRQQTNPLGTITAYSLLDGSCSPFTEHADIFYSVKTSMSSFELDFDSFNFWEKPVVDTSARKIRYFRHEPFDNELKQTADMTIAPSEQGTGTYKISITEQSPFDGTITLYEATTDRVSTLDEGCTSYMIESIKTNPLEEDKDSSLVFELQPPTDAEEMLVKRRARRSVDLQSQGHFHVQVLFVHDFYMYKLSGNNTQLLVNRTLELVNKINTMYRKHNIQFSVFGNEIWTNGDRITYTPDYSSFLTQFAAYVGRQEGEFAKADHVHLLTGRDGFNDNVIGLAYLGEMCSRDSSYAFSSDSPDAPINIIATLIAHELGHNLNLDHDTDFSECPCQGGTCIMAPSLNEPAVKHFSSCSLKSLQDFLSSWKSSCLRDQPLQIAEGSRWLPNTCGNNIVEEGEECDCGDEYFCTNPCCNPKTCLLTEGSQCFEGACCHGCQIRAAGTSCRGSTDQFCDLEDYCDGNTTQCRNTFKENGTPCQSSGSGICFKGNCKSHSLQCKTLWGNANTDAPPVCFEAINPSGFWYGNCGKSNGVYKTCPDEDVMCGTLQCTVAKPSNYPVIGWNKGYGVVSINSGSVKCVAAKGNLGRYEKDLSKSLHLERLIIY